MRRARPAGARPARVAAPARANAVDFDIGGAVVVRARDASPADVGLLSRELGGVGREPVGKPDLVVCFVDDIASRDPELIDDGSMAHGAGGLYFLSESGRAIAHTRRGRAWGRQIIVCRRGLKHVPSLSSAVDLVALARGWIPLHASGWIHEGVGFVATGGAGSGKTGALVAACRHGAVPLGDDRILLSADGRSMVGVGGSINLRDWHQTQLALPHVRFGAGRRMLAKLGTAIGRTTRARNGTAKADTLMASFAARGVAGVRRRLDMELALERLGNDGGVRGRPDILLVLEKRPRHGISAERIDEHAAVARIAAEVEAELRPGLGQHRAQRLQGRDYGWRDVHRAPEIAALLLHRALRGKPVYVVTHPPECCMDELHDLMVSLPRRDDPVDGADAAGSPRYEGPGQGGMPIRPVHA